MPTLEIWKPIPGHDGYEVSNRGRVRSIDRTLFLRNRWGDLKPRRYRGRILQQVANGFGYKCVKLGGHAEKEEVHRLVLLTFVGPRPSRRECAHWDGNPTNNNLSNLRYVTKLENYQDSVRHGNHSQGERQWQSRLTRKQVTEIRNSKLMGTVLAYKYGISTTHVCNIRKRKSWSWL